MRPSRCQTIAGYDPNEITSQDRPVGQYLEGMRRSRGRVRIGVPREFFYENLHPEVQAAIERALAVLGTLGAETHDVALQVSTDRTVIRAEAYAYHAEYLAKTPELYLPETLGKNCNSALDRWTHVHSSSPRPGSTAPQYAERVFFRRPSRHAHDAGSRSEGVGLPNDLRGCSRSGRIAPAEHATVQHVWLSRTISVPCGITSAGLPIGLQISGPRRPRPL